MLITVPCRPLSELLQAPDHCSVLGEVNFTNCPLAGRVVIGIRMGIVRPEQAKLQEPLGAFGKRVAGVALLPGGRCPRCTSSMIKCTSASPASAHHVRNKIKALTGCHVHLHEHSETVCVFVNHAYNVPYKTSWQKQLHLQLQRVFIRVGALD